MDQDEAEEAIRNVKELWPELTNVTGSAKLQLKKGLDKE